MIPESITLLDHAWSAFLEENQKALEGSRRVKGLISRACQDSYLEPYLSWDPAMGGSALNSAAERFVMRVINIAEHTFAPGMTLSIPLDHTWYLEPDTDVRHSALRLKEGFSMASVWRELEMTYREKAIDTAHEQLANRFARAWGLHSKPRVERAGKVILNHSVYSEASYRNGGLKCLSYSCADSLTGALVPLRELCHQFDQLEDAAAVSEMIEFVDSARSFDGFKSRTNFSGKRIKLTLFYNKLEVVLQPALSDLIDDYLGEHSSFLRKEYENAA